MKEKLRKLQLTPMTNNIFENAKLPSETPAALQILTAPVKESFSSVEEGESISIV